MTGAAGDPALAALRALGAQLDRTMAGLAEARRRVRHVERLRAAGLSWHEIVTQEERPLVVEALTRALDDLGAAGGAFRREEARALQREQVSMTRIGKLFGVSRQRVSAILHDQARSPRPDREVSADP
ncbi:hypothetical protein ACL02T_08360 [Pseudonocardia sp. RS010]|uniref:hypothetical protein n=1 Tax=Pseudonocardia sp. RS010 TaxID=3385979 RepID=UPI0039A27720